MSDLAKKAHELAKFAGYGDDVLFREQIIKALMWARELGNCGHCTCACMDCGGCNGQQNAKHE